MATSMHYGAKKETFRFASFLRKNLTLSEKKLWSNICNKLTGYKFRCQHPTWRYVTDFYCHELRLIIEVDGSIHLLDEIMQNDTDRENNLCSFGLNIIHFTNEEVLLDMDTVMDKIDLKINELKSNIELNFDLLSEEIINRFIDRLESALKSTSLENLHEQSSSCE